MDLRSLRQRVSRIGAAVTPTRRLHAGLLVRFVASDGNGKPAPLPADAPPIRKPEARDPSRGLDVVFIDVDGSELRCA
ncbi:MAG: hypothetical protein WCG85_18245 [Polyangia bacterium]